MRFISSMQNLSRVLFTFLPDLFLSWDFILSLEIERSDIIKWMFNCFRYCSNLISLLIMFNVFLCAQGFYCRNIFSRSTYLAFIKREIVMKALRVLLLNVLYK